MYAALHEAAHVIAALHYGIPIGDEGVFITEEHNGFTDSRIIQKWGTSITIDAMSQKDRRAYMTGCVIGPVAECSYALDSGPPTEQQERAWMPGFAAAVGVSRYR